MSIISTNNFVKTSGRKLILPDGTEFVIKSIGFGNNVWYAQNGLPITDHDEKSYQELAALGFNCIRFYLNAALFESDSNPYVYSKDAFDWLSQNIKWARTYNIKLLLNMHIPQGGKFSSTNVALWVTPGYKERFTALWKEIATRYAGETAVIGYGLLNEPFVPEAASSDIALSTYYDLMNKTATAIRSVDKNHILFIERPYGTVNTNTKQVNYVWGDTGSFRLINDKNTAYEFHFYDRNEFIFQGLPWLNYKSKWIYNSDKIAILSGARSVAKAYISDSTTAYKNSVNTWQYIESKFITPSTPYENYGYWMLYASHLGSNGSVQVDDIIVKEYNEKKEYVRDLYQLSFDTITACDGWDLGQGGGGSYSYNSSVGHNAPGCGQINGVLKTYRIYKSSDAANYFPLKNGYSYKLCAYVKFTNVNTDANVQLALQACHADKIFALNKAYLDFRLSDFIKLGATNNVPMYLGEFGIPYYLLGNEYKGEQWLNDIFDLLKLYKLNYSYHDYHDAYFGLYINDSRLPRNKRNDILYNIFKARL